MNNEKKFLSTVTRAVIALLMIIGFSMDGCQGNDGFFIVATLIWIYQPFIVRVESYILHNFHRSY